MFHLWVFLCVWQAVISSVSGLYTRRGQWRGSQGLVLRLQAVSRGFLLRQQLQARRRYLLDHTPAVVIIQVRRLKRVELHQQLHSPGGLVLVLWSWFSGPGGLILVL